MSFSFEKLEDRVLLAVSISERNGTLYITSNNASDSVEIDGLADDIVDVNGSIYNVSNLVIKMNGGNDEVFLNEVRLSGNVTIDTGAGADEVDIDNSDNGDDIGGTLIGGNLVVKMGNNAGDYFDVDASEGDGIEVVGNVTLDGIGDINMDGDGGDPELESDDITIGGNLTIRTNMAADVVDDGDDLTMFFDDVNVGGLLRIDGSNRHPDLISFEDVVIVGKTTIRTKGSLDFVSVADDANVFLSAFVYDGGASTNFFEPGPVDNDFFAGGFTLKNALTLL